jgi:hypothetical protein
MYRKPITPVRLSSTRSRVLRSQSRSLYVFQITVRNERRNGRSQVRIVRYRKALRVVSGVSLGVVRVAGIDTCLESVRRRLTDVTYTVAASREVLCAVLSIGDPFFAGEGTGVHAVH